MEQGKFNELMDRLLEQNSLLKEQNTMLQAQNRWLMEKSGLKPSQPSFPGGHKLEAFVQSPEVFHETDMAEPDDTMVLTDQGLDGTPTVIKDATKALTYEGLEETTKKRRRTMIKRPSDSHLSSYQEDNKVYSSSSVEEPSESQIAAAVIKDILEIVRESRTGLYSMEDVFVNKDDEDTPMATLDDESLMRKYEAFKKFDTVKDHADHLFSAHPSMKPASVDWVDQINKDRELLKKSLPETIFVRVYESRFDLLRAAILGPKGTPYHDGFFFFDVSFPASYPNTPPLLRYHSGRLFINPNLYPSGEVLLNLPRVDGSMENMWMAGTSTILDLLLYIQSRILNSKPLLNCPNHMVRKPTFKDQASIVYNENTFIKTLKTMVYIMNKPPKNFEELVVGHFRKQASFILEAIKAYKEGLQVGCPVSSLQPEGKKGIPLIFQNDLTSCINPLIAAFKKIGADVAEETLSVEKD